MLQVGDSWILCSILRRLPAMCSSFANFVFYAFVVKSLAYEQQKSKQNPQILNAPLPNSGVWEMGIATL